MVRLRKKKRKPKPQPIKQDIPKHIKKGDPVLYMLQRVGYHHALLVTCIVIRNPRKYEKKLLELFESDAIRMESNLSQPQWYTRHQVKFGITKNLQKRLDDINEDIFDSGVTEWRRISWAGYIIALFLIWWYRWRKVVVMVVAVIISLFILTLHLIFDLNQQ